MSTSSNTSARPKWLQDVLDDSSPPAKLYSWTVANLPGSHVSRPVQPRDPEREKQRIHILGVGNLGRLFAISLASLPNPPPITLIVHRVSLLEQWVSSPGVSITPPSGTVHHATNFDIEYWTRDSPSHGPVTAVCPVRNLVVATKAPAALPQVDELRGYLGPETTVVFVQNGMSRLWPPHGKDYCAHRWEGNGHPNFILGVTTHGVTHLGPFKSLLASPADVAVGPVLLNGQSPEAPEYLTERLLHAPYVNARQVSRSDLWVVQLEKLVVNSVVNPLTAVLRRKNGVLVEKSDGPIARVMDRLIEEASLVLQALVRDANARQLETDAEEDVQALLDRFSAPRLRAMVYSVCEKVKDNKSSMLQDVIAGKQTEICEFNGWLAVTASRYGLSTATHKTVIKLVEEGTVLGEDDLDAHFRTIQLKSL
jgi:2-dehydropantoate 2-reductase